MIQTIRITKDTDPHFVEYIKIYEQSFPLFEQRTAEQHLYALASPQYRLDCYIEGGTLVGFISYWEFDTYIYIEHLAIHPHKRGLNYGSRFVGGFIAQNQKQIILEIDPLVDDISIRRLRFYEALGFFRNDHPHLHVNYREGYPDHHLIVLSTGGVISQAEYQQFHSDLHHIVMAE